jgi:hypothetical protein
MGNLLVHHEHRHTANTLEEFDYSNVQSWSEETVSQWVTNVLSSMETQGIGTNNNGTTNAGSILQLNDIQQTIKKNKVDGKKMCELDRDDLFQMFNANDESSRSKVLKTFQPLAAILYHNDLSRKRKKTDEKKDLDAKLSLVVLRKLESFISLYKYTEADDFSAKIEAWDCIRMLAANLAVKEHILHSYLSKDTKETLEALELMLKSYGNDKNAKRELEKAKLIAKEAGLTYWKNLPNYASDVQIKLLIVEQSLTTIHKLCPFVWRMNNNYDRETSRTAPLKFSVALTIGPWYLEWNEMSLVVPQKCCSSAILYIEELGLPLAKKKINSLLPVIAEFVTKWNVERKYSTDTCNGLHFVYELLSELNIKKDFSSPILASLLKQIKTNGSAELVFPDIQEHYSMLTQNKSSPTTSTFNNTSLITKHKELDNFLWKNLQFLSPNDLMLLKCVDCALFSRWNTCHDLQFIPNGCFFKDPEIMTHCLNQKNFADKSFIAANSSLQ